MGDEGPTDFDFVAADFDVNSKIYYVLRRCVMVLPFYVPRHGADEGTNFL